MSLRWILTVLVTLTLGLSVAACGKKPRDVQSPPGSPSFPTQYPTSR
jgi:predicted small lipoprotein YifL